MASSMGYEKAPITEALIDLRFLPSLRVSLNDLQKTGSLFGSRFSKVEDILFAEGKFLAGASVSATATQTHLGYRFISADSQKVLQVRLDGFTFSHLAPYRSWESLRDEAKELWEFCVTSLNIDAVERVAVRYINRLDLPIEESDGLDLRKYLNTLPEIAEGFPQQALGSYFMQLKLPQPDLDASLVLNEATIPSNQEGVVSLVLDIDLFKQEEIDAQSMNIWNLLEKFRNRKNDFFEACITNSTRELFK